MNVWDQVISFDITTNRQEVANMIMLVILIFQMIVDLQEAERAKFCTFCSRLSACYCSTATLLLCYITGTLIYCCTILCPLHFKHWYTTALYCVHCISLLHCTASTASDCTANITLLHCASLSCTALLNQKAKREIEAKNYQWDVFFLQINPSIVLIILFFFI